MIETISRDGNQILKEEVSYMPRKINEQTEKITINVTHVDLGKIDLLVDNGMFTNRSDFIRTAIRDGLTKNEKVINEKIERDSFVIGIVKMDAEHFERYKKANEYLNIKWIGLIILDKDVTLDLLKETVKTFEVKGTIICNKEIKEYFNL